MEKYAYGFISNPNPDASMDLTVLKSKISLFLRILQSLTGANVEITIITGPLGHPLSDFVRKEAVKLGFAHKFGAEWGKPSSNFHHGCSTLVRMGDDSNTWCEEQEEVFRRAGGEMFML